MVEDGLLLDSMDASKRLRGSEPGAAGSVWNDASRN